VFIVVCVHVCVCVYVCVCVWLMRKGQDVVGCLQKKKRLACVRVRACMNGTLVKEYNFFYSDERQQPHPPALTIPLVPVF